MCDLIQPEIKTDRPMPEHVTELIKLAIHGAVHHLADGDEVPITFFAHGPKGMAVLAVHTLPSKDIISEMVKEFAKEHDVDTLVCLSEAWTLPEHLRKEFVENGSGDISNHPDRYEILMVSVETQDAGVWMGMSTFNGTGDTKTLPDFIEFKHMDDAMSSGRFTNLLPVKAPAGPLH